MKKIKTLHVITKLAIGGAQENTIYSAEYFNNLPDFSSEIICGHSPKESLEAEARAKGIRITKVDGLSNRLSISGYLKALRFMIKYIRKNRFTIVHTHSSVAGILGRIAARLAGTPIVIHTIHGWGLQEDMHPMKRKLYISLEKFCARFTRRMIAVAKDNVKKGLRLGIGNRKQYLVIRSGIEQNKDRQIKSSHKVSSLGLPPGRIVGMIGRLDHQKCPEDFIRIAEIVCRERQDVSFVFLGDGPLRKKVQGMIDARGLQKRVSLLGFRRDISDFLPLFDVFLLTSAYEGLPKVVLQAMDAKKPVVATAVDGTPEAVLHGENGFLSKVHDIDSMARHVKYLLDNPDVAREMGVKGSKRISDFSVEKMLSDLDALYRRELDIDKRRT